MIAHSDSAADSNTAAVAKSGVGWEHFPHGADIGVRGVGSSKAEAFEQAAYALTAVVTELDRVDSREAVTVTCRAPDDGLLLIEWLNSLIYEMATRKMIFAQYAVRIESHGLQGQAWGEAVDVRRHEPAVEIKGATVTELAVTRRPDGLWLAQCVVDV